jgi:Zn-dependent oligopeptidase
MSLLNELNNQYVALHEAKENAFWAQKMGLADYAPGEFERHEIALKDFSGDPANLERVREELKKEGLSEEERVGLGGWQRFFEVNIIESPEARALFERLVELEGALDANRRSMALGYTDPTSGEFVRASSVQLGLMISTAPNEATRKAAWEGLRAIEPHVLDNGLIEIVRERNRLARMLGYEDYYDWKVSINEGFNKAKLFELLDDLETNTREAARASMEGLTAEHGADASQPWNSGHYQTGDITALTDPYFRFEEALKNWGTLFAAMNIRYSGATMQLDLVDREGKYENGFMHGPLPTYVENGTFHPARINFTANAVPGQIGSGKRALQTLLHEGGHAAHFSNVRMPAPCFSQEFAPTSVAFAETQSMFLDSLMGDADWLTRYATNAAGEPMPIGLIDTTLEKEHRFRAHKLRTMLVVSYFEKALYEMSDAELTPGNILNVARDIESRLLLQPAATRPVLSIPHLLSGESSAYYHGYTLAQMGVYQTRDYFRRKYGYIVDNPKVGPELAEKFWRPGNSKNFLEFIEDLTGEPFSARATVELVNKSLDDVRADARRAIAHLDSVPAYDGPIDLDANIAVVHGDDVIARGVAFEELSTAFSEWIGTGGQLKSKN